MKRRPRSTVPGKQKDNTLRRLGPTLREEEERQLRAFLRQRSQAVDEEIRRLTTKLREPGSEQELERLLHRVQQPSSTPTQSTPNSIAAPPLELKGEALPIQPRASSEEMDASSALTRFITKFQDSLRQADISPKEFRQICFPPGITGAYDTKMPLSEFMDILITDLMLTPSMREQQALLSKYGVSERTSSPPDELDVKAFLVDADAWSSDGDVKDFFTDQPKIDETEEFILDTNTKANIQALKNIYGKMLDSNHDEPRLLTKRTEESAEAVENESRLLKDIQKSSKKNEISLDQEVEGPEPLPPSYAISSTLLSGEDVYKELKELREKYAELEAKQRPVSTETEITYSQPEPDSRPYGLSSSNFVRESLRELDRGTFFSRPELRSPGFSHSAESPQLKHYTTWTHPSKGTRSTIPSLTSVISRSFTRTDSADLYNPALDKSEVSISKLSEQSIVSKIRQLPDPERSINTLVNRIIDQAALPDNSGYITCPLLMKEMKSVGLRVTEKDVQIFSAGIRFNWNV